MTSKGGRPKTIKHTPYNMYIHHEKPYMLELGMNCYRLLFIVLSRFVQFHPFLSNFVRIKVDKTQKSGFYPAGRIKQACGRIKPNPVYVLMFLVAESSV